MIICFEELIYLSLREILSAQLIAINWLFSCHNWINWLLRQIIYLLLKI